MTSVTGTLGGLRINALNGAEVELDNLATITARDVDATSDVTGSVLDFAALTSWTDTNISGALVLSNGGVAQFPVLATMTAGSITVTNQSTTFPAALVNINGTSLFVTGTNSLMSLPGVTSWAEAVGVTSFFNSNGPIERKLRRQLERNSRRTGRGSSTVALGSRKHAARSGDSRGSRRGVWLWRVGRRPAGGACRPVEVRVVNRPGGA